MNAAKKIYASIFVWVVITAGVFYFAFPKISNYLVSIEQSHEDQIAQYNNLREQIQSLYAMQQDLDQVQKQDVKPSDFFTSDVQLVKEIQRVESIAALTGNQLKISISGNAGDAKQLKTSSSQLYEVPYTIDLTGTFPQAVQFLHYFENSYFVSPVNAVDIDNSQGGGQVKTTILASFFIHKDQSNDQAKPKN